MVELTTTALIQIVAMLTLPAIVVAIAATQMNTRAKFQWKQGKIALVLSVLPALFVFALQGILSPWMVLVCIGALFVIVAFFRPDLG